MGQAVVEIELVDGALADYPAVDAQGGGAAVRFEGIVREDEAGQRLTGLRYEAYPPMTARELRRLGERTAAEFGLLGLWCRHSVGEVAVGERSFCLDVAAAHRAEALAGMQFFIDEMKRGVPLWKVPVFEGEAGRVR